jgi:cytochrome c-type biogenesis protein CcmH/NrfF
MTRGARAALLTLLAAVAAIAPAAAAGAESRASLPDIEDEVMCPICGTLLELSQSPQAQRERVFIRRLIARGESKQQVKDALVAEYGQEVLAVPDDSGFDLTAYLVPVLAFAAAAIALAFGILRWRRSAGGGPRPPGPTALKGEEAERLDADLARYDL